MHHPVGSSAKRSGNFPPPEVLEICLDHYFRRFHPIAPFIHVPSFDASNTPLPLLYAMCMLGLSVLESSNGGSFISNAFTVSTTYLALACLNGRVSVLLIKYTLLTPNRTCCKECITI
jgi:hypothetical protein